MLVSLHYTNLSKRIDQLGTHLLPPLNPVGYSDRDLDLIRGYCLLCHAEFEYYLEEIVRYVATEAVNKWRKNLNAITPIVFHLAFSYSNASNKREPPYSMVNMGFNNLIKAIDSNNGIKENNITCLLKPIGFAIDSTLQLTLENFGKKRGQLAHSSFSTHTMLDPVIEKKEVIQILSGLNAFDIDLNNYYNSAPSTIPFNMQLGRLNWKERLRILFKGK